MNCGLKNSQEVKSRGNRKVNGRELLPPNELLGRDYRPIFPTCAMITLKREQTDRQTPDRCITLTVTGGPA